MPYFASAYDEDDYKQLDELNSNSYDQFQSFSRKEDLILTTINYYLKKSAIRGKFHKDEIFGSALNIKNKDIKKVVKNNFKKSKVKFNKKTGMFNFI